MAPEEHQNPRLLDQLREAIRVSEPSRNFYATKTFVPPKFTPTCWATAAWEFEALSINSDCLISHYYSAMLS